MARHAQPLEIARLKGADKKNPQRYKATAPKSKLPLGEYPAEFSNDPADCWFEISSLSVPGVLTASDRFVLEITAHLLAEYRTNRTDFAVGKYTHLVGCFARLGMSPTDRTKLGMDGADKEDNPYASLDD